MEEFYRAAMGIQARNYSYDSILSLRQQQGLDKATDVMKTFIDEVEGAK